MSPQSRPTARVCAVTDALDIVGDRYSLPIVRELLYGNTRFSDLLVLVGAPRTVLAGRLRRLEAVGAVERRRYSERPPRDEYVLTESGRDLLPVLIALKEWGDKYCGNRQPSRRLRFAHSCGQALRTEVVCASCREPIRFGDLVVTGKLGPPGKPRV